MAIPIYFPLTSDRYTMPMNAQAGVEHLIEIDTAHYHSELQEKGAILASDTPYYFHAPPETEPLAWEVIALLLQDMAHHSPADFTLQVQGSRWTWHNHLLGTETLFLYGDSASLPLPPLDWIGRQVQEDLILLTENATGEAICVAGHLCFGSAWSLMDKVGQSFLSIHDPVPEFRSRIGQPSDLLLRRLKAGRPVCRLNWSVTCNDQLNLAPALADHWHRQREGITVENAAERLFWRIERQTLSRLPQTGGILFTIHTYVHPLREVIADPVRRQRLRGVMHDYPEAMKVYKGMTSYFDVVLAFLDTFPNPAE